jgi:hypothetical protein
MKSRLVRSAALLFTFVLGLASYHPIAIAMENLAASTCLATKACVAALNQGKGPAFKGSSQKGSGLLGITKNPSATLGPQYGVFGWDNSTDGGTDDGGVKGFSRAGAGVVGLSSSGYGMVGASTTSIGLVALTTSTVGTSSAILADAESGAAIFSGTGAAASAVTIDAAANITTTGQIFTSGSCSSGCVVHRRVRSYGATAASPMMEDTGEAQLAFGTTYVRLDPSFANAIDPIQSYVVLITPEGDTRGLFVARRTPAGFTVRETSGGRSSTPFAYRIVAHPYGVREARLPFVTMPSRPAIPTALR